jgi:VCBS repeat protein
MRIKGIVVLAALAAAAVTVGLGQSASAAERTGSAPKSDDHTVVLAPAKDKQARSVGGGGRSHDFTGDGIPDILARSTSGALLVYPNSGTFNGTATYPSSTFINGGWGGFSWVGSADLNGDGFADVVATDFSGNLFGAIHSGLFDGTRTLRAGLVFLGSGWNINDMAYVYDYNGDGFDDLLARRGGTGDSYVYFNNGLNGTNTFQAPALFMTGGYFDSYQNVADVTLDGLPDFIYMQSGHMYVLPLNGSQGADLGFGWDTVNSVIFTDVDNDGRDDILARRYVDSSLVAYRHSGSFAPVAGKAYSTYRAPVVVGLNWNVNDIIT